MRAIGYIATNQADINEATRLNIKIPEAIMAEKEILIPVGIILLAFVHEDKIICTTSLGKELHLKYEEEVWKRIESHLIHI